MTIEKFNKLFYCSLSGKLMKDPVTDREGYHYERNEIINYLNKYNNNISPITNNYLNINQIVSNKKLKEMIEKEIKEYELQSQLSSLSINMNQDNEDENEDENEYQDNQDIEENEDNEEDKNLSLSLTMNTNMNTNLNQNKKIGENKDMKVMVTIHPPNNSNQRNPIDLVCVVDTSGSMGESAAIKGMEDSGLSLLDIVKHALKTIIVMLSDGDRISLVTYSNSAKVIFQLTTLNQAGRTRVNNLIDGLTYGGMTNLWDGLSKGLDVLSNDPIRIESTRNGMLSRNSAIFLLTDGIPNVEPPRGHIPRLRRYKDSHGGVYPATISTFGFGYNLKSSLLKEIAIEGGGMYSFIPDSGFVGTAFVNALSNQLVCFGHRASLTIECRNGVKIIDDEDSNYSICDEINNQKNEAIINVGSLQYGQSRNFIIHLTYPNNMSEEELSENCRCGLTYTPYYNPSDLKNNIIGGNNECLLFDYVWNQSSESLTEMEIQCFRNRLIQYISTLVSEGETELIENIDNNNNNNNQNSSINGKKNTTNITKDNNLPSRSLLANDFRDWLRIHPKSRRGNRENDIKYDIVNGMFQDINGQINEAFSKKEYFDRWGIHYLPSLQRAHELQQCTNFKDPGVQHYGGTLFQQVSKMGDEMFCTLPPPIPLSLPSRSHLQPRLVSVNYNYQDYQSQCQSYSYHPSYNPHYMSAYHSSSAPCFHGSCLVTMADGTKKTISNIKQGDYVLCPSSTHTTNKFDENKIIISRVESILRTFTRFGVMELVSFESGLLVTPWHPIKVNGKWTFPANTIEENQSKSKMICKMTEAVYSFLLGTEIIIDKNDLNNPELFHELSSTEKAKTITITTPIKRGQSMLINDIECITLAHGIMNDEIATHSFYGSENVVNSMKKKVHLLNSNINIELPEYVNLHEGDIIKDDKSQLACGFK